MMASVRIFVAPQEFKGSLTAKEAAAAIVAGLGRALPDAEVEALPLADGGPGTVEVLVEATAGLLHEADAHDALDRPLRAFWGSLGERRDNVVETAVIEMAAASGLALLRPEDRDPRRASTRGTGELVQAVLDASYRRIIVGVGGSATNDGGAGLAQALGARLLDAEGRELPPGGVALARLDHIDVAGLDARLSECQVIVATDVTNPLCGPDGASLVYGPQKGATEAMARELDAALEHYGRIVRRDLGVDVANVPGAGAAGGLAAGLIAFCGAEVRAGFDVVAETVGLGERVRGADIVITGEGRLDRQSGFGKTTSGVAREAREAGKPVVALVGSIQEGSGSEVTAPFDSVFALTPDFTPPDEATARASDVLAKAAEEAGRRLAAMWEDAGR